jgi:hypothetical protein
MVNKKTNKKKVTSKRAPRRRMGRSVGFLDEKAREYARLLSDPCNGPIVPPIYPGGDSGFLFRAESFVTFGIGATETSGIFHWTPGYVNATNTHLLAIAGALGSTSITMANQGGNAPGTAFLAANAKGARCVSACLKLTYPGAENTRAGRLHYGLTSSGMLDSAQATTADNVAQTLQHFSRTPADTVELIWRPSIGDTEFNDPTEAAGAPIKDRKEALTVAWVGLPVATGLTFHMTAVYEWTPAVGLGVGHNALGKAVSRNTLDDVIDYLVQAGFTFVKHAGTGAGHMLSAGLLGAMSNSYGLMAANGRTRPALNFR